MRVLLPVQTVWVDSSEGAEGYEVRFPGDGCTLRQSLRERSLRLGAHVEMDGGSRIMSALADTSTEVDVIWVSVRLGDTLLRQELVDPQYSLRVLVPVSPARFSPEGRQALNDAAGCIVDLQENLVRVRTGASVNDVLEACWAYLRPRRAGAVLVHEGPRAVELCTGVHRP